MNCLVTGAAGFIGSHLCEALMEAGHRVVGLDALTDTYDAAVKWWNLQECRGSDRFTFWEERVENIHYLFGETDWVFHLAARAGVRTSWGRDFAGYCRDNVLATQCLLETCAAKRPRAVVFASSSSVYGDQLVQPIRENARLEPISPYGATKVMGEQLCELYRKTHGVPVTMLRYFTVYGPRQRPDMAFAKWIKAVRENEPITIYGDGEQKRDFTYVADVVRATIAAAENISPGSVYNIAGGEQVTVNEVLTMLTELTGEIPNVQYEPVQVGDAKNTWGDTSRARARFGFESKVCLRDGLADQLAATEAMMRVNA